MSEHPSENPTPNAHVNQIRVKQNQDLSLDEVLRCMATTISLKPTSNYFSMDEERTTCCKHNSIQEHRSMSECPPNHEANEGKGEGIQREQRYLMGLF